MRLKKLIKMFHSGSVAVFGACGSGKDVLLSNIAVREKLGYISNCNYGGVNGFHVLDVNKINLPNNYDNFINGKINKYFYPYPEHVNIYISDINTIFPSEHDSSLSKKYPGIPTFWQLHRHLADNHIHCNCQTLNRVWIKIREHSEFYIMCRRCRVLFGKIVLLHIRIYDKFDSAYNKVLPFRFPLRLKSKDLRKLVEIEKAKFINQYGIIKNRFLIFFHKSDYETRFYKKVLEQGTFEYN